MKSALYSLLFVLFVLCSCIPGSAMGVNSQYMAKQAIESSVVIQERVDWGWSTVGSGVAVRRHNALYMGPEPKFAILTAEHVIKAEIGENPTYRACAVLAVEDCVILGSYISGQHNHAGSGKDWALALVPDLPEQSRVARVHTRSLNLGQQVIIVGHPWARFWVSHGTVAAHRIIDGQKIVMVDGYAAPGTSGGGVYDHRGRLIGIVVALAVERGPTGFIPEYQHEQDYVVPVGNVVW